MPTNSAATSMKAPMSLGPILVLSRNRMEHLLEEGVEM